MGSKYRHYCVSTTDNAFKKRIPRPSRSEYADPSTSRPCAYDPYSHITYDPYSHITYDPYSHITYDPYSHITLLRPFFSFFFFFLFSNRESKKQERQKQKEVLEITAAF